MADRNRDFYLGFILLYPCGALGGPRRLAGARCPAEAAGRPGPGATAISSLYGTVPGPLSGFRMGMNASLRRVPVAGLFAAGVASDNCFRCRRSWEHCLFSPG